MPIATAAATQIPTEEPVAQVFSEHAPFVFRTAYGVTGSHEDAEDVLQTVFLRLIRREASPDFRANPRAYLYRAALNASFDVMRSRRLVAVAELPEMPGPGSESIDDEHHRALYEAIAELKPESAQILAGRFDFHHISEVPIDLADPNKLDGGMAAVRRAAVKTVGFELEEARAPFDVWIIESAEKATEN